MENRTLQPRMPLQLLYYEVCFSSNCHDTVMSLFIARTYACMYMCDNCFRNKGHADRT